jgi:hypothetical protein
MGAPANRAPSSISFGKASPHEEIIARHPMGRPQEMSQYFTSAASALPISEAAVAGISACPPSMQRSGSWRSFRLHDLWTAAEVLHLQIRHGLPFDLEIER